MTLFYRLYQRGGAFYRRLRDKVSSALAVFRRRFFDWIDERSVMWLRKVGTSESMKQRTLRRLKRGKVRSLWGCTPILTLPMKSRADRSLGFVSHSLVFTTYGIFRNFDINLSKLVGLSYRLDYTFGGTIHRFVLYIAMRRYDVFHFFFDRGILVPPQRFGISLEELDLLRAAGKRVYVYAYGADVRLREKTLSLGRWNFCIDCPEIGKFCFCDDAAGRRTLAEIAQRVTCTVALGDMINYVPGCRIMHYWPIDTEAITPLLQPATRGPLLIAHAPNHAHFKGSHYLEAVIDRLWSEGHTIRYVKVQGVPNAEVIRLFGEADIVADQLIGGAYGYTALEGMARSKPVLTYVRSPDLVEAADECPLINTTPDTLEAVLRWLLDNRDRLPQIGAQGRAYVERWHSIGAVAERLGRMYEETADFPKPVLDKIMAQRRRENAARAAIRSVCGWEHPFRIADIDHGAVN
jgi:hypothetical protein